MFYSPKLYLRDRWIFASLLLAVVSQGFSWWYIFYNIKPSPEQFFLHYNIIFGVDLAGEWWKLLYLPIAGLVVIIVNFSLSFYFYERERLLARLLSLAAALFHIFLVVATVLIVGLNL
ncbi:MAG: hypothetical protein Q7S66_03130 [bacterium]|nr:hypothetical protein [bacterium]